MSEYASTRMICRGCKSRVDELYTEGLYCYWCSFPGEVGQLELF